MYPTNVAVIICSAIIGLIRFAMVVKNYRGFEHADRTTSLWSDPIFLSRLSEAIPFLLCILSIAFASCGLTQYGLSAQWAIFSTLSIFDLLGAKQWFYPLPGLGRWQKAGIWTVVLLSLAGIGIAAGLPTIYTPFVMSLVFGMVYAYITKGSTRWGPYLAFTLLLFGAAIALGVSVFKFKMSQLSDYSFLLLNLLHPRTVHGSVSWWKSPSKLKLSSTSNSTSNLNEVILRSLSTPANTPPTYHDALWVTHIYHGFLSEPQKSPYHHRSEKGKGFVSEDV